MRDLAFEAALATPRTTPRTRRAQAAFQQQRAKALATPGTSVLTKARLLANMTAEELCEATKVYSPYDETKVIASVSPRTLARMEAGGLEAAGVSDHAWQLVCDALGRTRRQLDSSFVA